VVLNRSIPGEVPITLPLPLPLAIPESLGNGVKRLVSIPRSTPVSLLTRSRLDIATSDPDWYLVDRSCSIADGGGRIELRLGGITGPGERTDLAGLVLDGDDKGAR
jgi:hypothetical protein